MEENEAWETIQKYFSKNNELTIHFFGSGDNPRMFSEFVQTGQFYVGDTPDMLLRKGNTAIIIEHFEIDSSRANRKGSSCRKELSRIERAEKLVEYSEEGTFFHDEISVNSSYAFLLENVKKNFEHHYSHIGMYRENLKKWGLIAETDVVKVMFLIDDVSPLGTIAVPIDDRNAKPCPVVLAQSKEFLELMQKSPDVDFVLACSGAGNQDFLWFIDNNQLDSYFSNIIDYESMDFLDITPHIFSFKMAIPSDVSCIAVDEIVNSK